MKDHIGKYTYVVGVVAALTVGILAGNLPGTVLPLLTSVIVVAGLVVGFINIGDKDIKDFLLVSTVLIIAAGVGSIGKTLENVYIIGSQLSGIFGQLLAFVVPATTVVALKNILTITKK